MKKTNLLLPLALCLPFAVTACDGEAEDLGENVDEAVDDMGDAAEDAADDVEDAAEDMTDGK